MSNPKFGSDPEVFAYYDQWESKYAVSPITLEDEYGLRPIQDDIKHPTYYNNEDGKVIMDGVAFELNLLRPFDTASAMFIALKKLQSEFNDWLIYNLGWEVVALPSIKFDNDRWWLDAYEQDERKLMGFIFGCDRSYNAILDEPAPFIDARHHPYRYGGGHIHISHPILVDNPLQAVRCMDMLYGTYFMSKSPYKEEELERSKIYGKPASYRPQKYPDGSKGIEYRSPSNNWLNLTVEEFSMLDVLTEKVLVLLTDKTKLQMAFNEFLPVADEAIITANFDLAGKICNAVLSV